MSEFIKFIEEKYQQYAESRQSSDKNKSNNDRKKIIGQVCAALPKNNQLEKIVWFEDALKDDLKKWFALDIFIRAQKLPKNLLIPFIQTAIKEKDVSLHGYFIKPCVLSFGEDRISVILRGYLTEGTDEEKESAKHLLFWVSKFGSSGQKPDNQK